MIDVYAFATPNSVKIPIAFEELAQPYRLIGVNVRKGEQSKPEFLALNPNGKVPVVIDPQGPDGKAITIAESGAILIYLAEKFGGLLPKDPRERVRCLEWLFFQVAGLGPMFGQSGYFLRSAPQKPAFALERYTGEAKRHLAVFDQHLAHHEWAAGQTYSIADIALFGWIWRREFAGVNLDDKPHVARWFEAMEQRSAVKKAVEKVGNLVPAT